MVDTNVDTNTGNASNERAMDQSGLVWLSPDVGYVVYVEGSTADLEWRKITDFTGTPSYGTAADLTSDVTRAYSGWYDRWTPGLTGQKYHMTYNEQTSDNTHHREIDFGNSDTVSAETTINNGATYAASLHGLSACKSRSDLLYCAYNGDSGTEAGFAVSANEGATWDNTLASPWESAYDTIVLMPGGETDQDDIIAVYLDRSASEVTIKVYDATGDSWSEGASFSTVSASSNWPHICAAPIHSDNATAIGIINDHIAAGGDFEFYILDALSTTPTAKADVYTNQSRYAVPQVCVNQQNGDIYAVYSDGTTVGQIQYRKTDDEGTTWGTETALSDDSDDNRGIMLPPSIGDDGGQIMATWYDDDDGNLDTNEANGVTIAAAGVGGTAVPVFYHHQARHWRKG